MKKIMVTAAALALWLATPALAGQMGGDKLQGSMGGDPLDIATGQAKQRAEKAPATQAPEADDAAVADRAIAGTPIDPESLPLDGPKVPAPAGPAGE